MKRAAWNETVGVWHVLAQVQDTCPPSMQAKCRTGGPRGVENPCGLHWLWHSAMAWRPKLTQGFFRSWAACLCALLALWLPVATAAHPPCPGPAPALRRLSAQVWQVPGVAGETNQTNRGGISNLLVLRDGSRTWLLGSGPSPAYGVSLRCQIRAATGHAVTDVIAPWPRAELVLGATAFPAARLWSQADVAAAMRERCTRCVARMKLRLAGAAGDMGPHPIRIATHQLHGDQGDLGPFRWWKLQRADATAVTVFRLRELPLWVAPGLLWADAPPDLRDAELGPMTASIQRLAELARADGDAARWLPEQGELMAADAPVRHARYLQQLQADVLAALREGALETDPPPPPASDSLPLGDGLRHGLNWQRAWHLLEAQALDEPPAVAR